MYQRTLTSQSRLAMLFLYLGVFVFLVLAKLFYLQVINHGEFVEMAQAGRQGYQTLAASRGEIFMKDFHSNDYFRVATNITLDTVFADPYLIEDSEGVTDDLVSHLFDEEEALKTEDELVLEQRAKMLPEIERVIRDEMVTERLRAFEAGEVEDGYINEELLKERVESRLEELVQPRPIDELKRIYREDLYEKLSTKIREQILLVSKPELPLRKEVMALGLRGIEVDDTGIYAYPKQISDTREYAGRLSELIDIPVERLEAILEGKNRYVVLKKRIKPEVSEELRTLKEEEYKKYRGLGFQKQTYRYYPERDLAPQVLGFLNTKNEGIYGLEAAFEEKLKGKAGLFKAQLDGVGRQVTVGDDVVIEAAKDGADLYLTLDRSIQKFVEDVLARAVEANDADSGEILIMDPKTGKMLAMAHYPTFDPNAYWEALETEPVLITDERESDVFTTVVAGEEKTFLVENEETEKYLELLPIEDAETGEIIFESYKNRLGAGVYRNRIVSDVYEPGSVFKAITMAIGLDAAGITPNQTVNDDGPIKVDEFIIDNALGQHYGIITMTQVLETSNNIGMGFVARELGANLFYSYMKKFGLGRPTEIEFNGEQKGVVEKFNKWSESELVTHAFGQGISTTPIQMITAFSALANDGVLMKPYVIEKVEHDGRVEEKEPQVVERVISPQAAETIKAMLTSVIENGQLKNTAKIDGYTVAGKTGTSQTYRNGKPLEGAGTTITTFAGFAPVDDPKFAILIKIDRPRTSPWAANVTAPVFKEIGEYLFDYFAIAPN